MTDLSREARIRQFGEDLRVSAQLSGSFMKPASKQCGPWGVMLSFGSRDEMVRLQDAEDQQREQHNFPKRDRKFKPAPTWQLSVRVVTGADVTSEDFSDLGMICKAVGVPESKVAEPTEIIVGGRQVMMWQWQD